MHGLTTLILMKTNVDNTAFALAGNVVKEIDFSALLSGGKFITAGSFLTFTGFTDKALVNIGSSSGDQNLRLCNTADGTILEEFGPVPTGANTSFSSYRFAYMNSFEEIP